MCGFVFSYLFANFMAVSLHAHTFGAMLPMQRLRAPPRSCSHLIPARYLLTKAAPQPPLPPVAARASPYSLPLLPRRPPVSRLSSDELAVAPSGPGGGTLSEYRAPSGAAAGPLAPREPVGERARSWLYNALVLATAGMCFLLYRLSVAEEGRRKQTLAVLAAQLRRQRVSAKRAVVKSSGGQDGVVPLTGGGALRFAASGPLTARTVVLLHAEDGESAAFWGLVHASVAKRASGSGEDVCVVSFCRETASGSALPSAGRGTTVPLALRVRDVEAMLSHLEKSDGGSTSGGLINSWRRWILREPPPRAFVLVTHGEGAWGGLAAVGLHAGGGRGSIGGIAGSAFAPVGFVAVAPALMHRGASLAWWDALAGASRRLPASDPELLERLLDAPPLPLDGALLRELDARSPRRKQAVDLGERLGLGSASKSPAAARRLAEDFRRARSRQPLISREESQIVENAWAMAAASTSPSNGGSNACCARSISIRVVTHGPQSLAPLATEAQLLPLQFWWLQGAVAVGALTAAAPRLQRLAALREANMTDVIAELSGGQLDLRGGSTSAPPSREAAAPVPRALSPPPADAYELATLAGLRLNEHAASAGALAGDADARLVSRALTQLPGALGIAEPRPPVSRSFTFLNFECEARALGSCSCAAHSSSPSAGVVGDFSVSLVGAPSPATLANSPGQRDTREAADALAAVVNIPLQAPDAVADAVLGLLAARTHVAAALPPQATFTNV